MDVAWGLIRILQGGVNTNWYGLACPPHCGSPIFGTLLAALLSGILLGFGLCASLCYFLLGLRLCPASPDHPRAGQIIIQPGRLARYLHECAQQRP